MTKKTKYLGRESLKSSSRFFGGAGRGVHGRGDGASAGDGKTTDRSIVGKIVAVFLKDDGTPAK